LDQSRLALGDSSGKSQSKRAYPSYRRTDPNFPNTILIIQMFRGHYDDFAINALGRAWIATHPDDIVEVITDRGQSMITNETLLLNPTSAAFGRGSLKQEKILYITNGGNFVGKTLIDKGVEWIRVITSLCRPLLHFVPEWVALF
jgi:hypothetical protein